MRRGGTVRSRCAAALLAAACGFGAVAPGSASTLRPRTPLPKPATLAEPDGPSFLVVKFRDALEVRALAGGLRSEAGVVLDALETVRARHALTFEQLIDLPQSRLDALEARAAARSGVAQPDLAGMLVVHAPAADRAEVARALLALDEVEWVEFLRAGDPPPCSDLAPATPNYFAQGLQSYHGPDPGVDMTYLWSLGARGQGIRIADCEYGFILGTEDLCNVALEPGQTIHPTVAANGWDNHGTAVLGEMVGLDNAYGVTGLSPDALPSFFSEWTVEGGSRRVTAITNAIASVDAGDVVVLEMQSTILGGETYGPAELSSSVWTVTRAGTDAGVIVVGAAGNGNQNLDGSAYDAYRARGDSGAILVGAGTPNTSHSKLSFSTYGQRVDVQGWGQSVFTLGYGAFAELGGDPRQRYTSSFSGTSSATPIVAASVAALQSLAEQELLCRLEPLRMRQLLIDTGIPQGSGGHIGPLPNVRAAAEALLALGHCSYGTVCGDDLREGPEECDGEDDGTCPGLCSEECACLPPAVSTGEVHDLRVAGIAGSKLALTYTPACEAHGNSIVFGPLAEVPSYGYSGHVCEIGNGGSYDLFAPGPDSYFFLVVAHGAAGTDGSYGRDGDGQERPSTTLDAACPRVQDLAAPCDAEPDR